RTACDKEAVILRSAWRHNAFAGQKRRGEICGINDAKVLQADGDRKGFTGVGGGIGGNAAFGRDEDRLRSDNWDGGGSFIVDDEGKILVEVGSLIGDAIGVNIGSGNCDDEAAADAGRKENAFDVVLEIGRAARY